jgi:hypothetical protein
MRNFQGDRFLLLATQEASPTRLAQGHSRRLGFDPTFRHSSTFLRPFAPSPLRDFVAVGSEVARLHASHRPPLKLHVRFSRMQLSRRHLLRRREPRATTKWIPRHAR